MTRKHCTAVLVLAAISTGCETNPAAPAAVTSIAAPQTAQERW